MAKQFEIYLPMRTNDGRPVDPAKIQQIKDTLVQAFGGYTHLDQRFEGAWRMGGVTMHDDVTILSVLDDGTARFDVAAFKRSIEAALEQDAVLIVARDVQVV
jgi:hypothetical protein